MFVAFLFFLFFFFLKKKINFCTYSFGPLLISHWRFDPYGRS